MLAELAFCCCLLIKRISSLVLRHFTITEVSCFMYFDAEFGYVNTRRINHLRSK